MQTILFLHFEKKNILTCSLRVCVCKIMDENNKEPANVEMVPDDQLTKALVQNYIAYGQLTARFPKPGEGWSDAYDVIQKIFHADGSVCKNWYRCSWAKCGKILYQNASKGTKPLLRHREKHLKNEESAKATTSTATTTTTTATATTTKKSNSTTSLSPGDNARKSPATTSGKYQKQKTKILMNLNERRKNERE